MFIKLINFHILICFTTFSFAGMIGEGVKPSEPGKNPFKLIQEVFQPRNSELKELIEQDKILEALGYYNQAHYENIKENQKRDQYLDFDEKILSSLANKSNNLIESDSLYKELFLQGEEYKNSSLDNWSKIKIFIKDSQAKIDEYSSYKLFDNFQFHSNLINQLKSNREVLIVRLTESLQNNFLSLYKENPNFFDNYPLDTSSITYLSFDESQINNICNEPVSNIKQFSESFPNFLSYSDKEKLNQCIFAKEMETSDDFETFFAKIKNSLDDGSLSSIPRELLTVVKISPNKKYDFDYNFTDTHKFYITESSFDRINLINAKFKILIVPKIAQYQSKTIERDTKSSRYHVRNDRYPNPEYARAQNEYYSAQQDSNRNAIADTMPKNYGYGAVGALAAILDIAADVSVSSSLNDAENKLNSTPQYLERPVYESYDFNVSKVNTNKRFEADIYILSDKNIILTTSFAKSNEEDFDLAFNLHPQDTSTSYYKSQEDVDYYQKQAFDFDMDTLLTTIIESKKLEKLDSFEAIKNKITAIDKQDIIRKAKKNVTAIKADKRFDSVVVILAPDGSHGTGFYISPNLIVTNYHVVEGQKFLEIKKYDGSMTFGKVEKIDIDKDLALLKVEANGVPINFFSAKEFPLGSTVDAIGHPNGLNFSITRGVVSAIRDIDLAGSGQKVALIQTDTPINPGNSGGPLFFQNEVIGVNVMKQVANDTEGLGFAIHHSEVINFLYN